MKKILHVISSANPEGGGPIEAVKQMGALHPQYGHTVEVLTLDNPEAPFLKDFPLKVYTLGTSGKGYQYSLTFVPWLKQNAHHYEAVIINGLWQYHSFGVWRALKTLQIPYYVFTHGMLDPWFKATYPLKHLKKWLYWPWAEYRVLRDATQVFFTCEEEQLLARQSFWLYSANEKVVNLGTTAPPKDMERLRDHFYHAYPQLSDTRNLIFLGRIHPKKGCDILIQSFAQIHQSDEKLRLVMAGPDPVGWRKELTQLAEVLGIADKVVWTGMLHGDLKWGALYASEAFVLPSHQENFGIVVAESLGCGLPVLISNKINIWREVESDHAGFVSDPTVAGTVNNLITWLTLEGDQKVKMKIQARVSFEIRFRIEATVKSISEIILNYYRARRLD